MRLYHSSGRAHLVCPRLLQLDPRHGDDPQTWPPCRRGQQCPAGHEHESELLDPEGHRVDGFHWFPGCRPPTAEEWPRCNCGRKLVWSAGLDPLGSEHLREVEAAADA